MLDIATLLAHSKDLDLVVRHVLAGLGHGLHAGRERGAGVEFSEYRAYAPGDEWRRVDWKLLARNDRYYVREAERDSHVAVWFWLDASASMGEASHRYAQVSKLAYARAVIACLAAVAQRQGDAFGLLIAQHDSIDYTPASRGPRHLQRIMARLNQTTAGGALPNSETIRSHLHFARAPSMVFAIGDFLEPQSATEEALLRLRRMQHDVRALCLRTEAEVKADFSENMTYCDPEMPQYWVAFDRNAQDVYLQKAQAHFEQLRANCRRADIPYLEACIEDDPTKTIRAFLRKARPV